MTKRNPCKVVKIEYNENGVIEVERRGYAQERKTIDGVEMTFVMEGGDSGIGLWYPTSNVTMTKGKWTNAKRE
tara:strand:+ start:337 stop:555 length:219 start_codon:yes stop_codon:yes gene_type:complete